MLSNFFDWSPYIWLRYVLFFFLFYLVSFILIRNGFQVLSQTISSSIDKIMFYYFDLLI